MTSEARTSGGVRGEHEPASAAEVRDFLDSTSFSGYQGMAMPHGLRLPGDDRRASVDAVLAGGVQGCRVLDVGTYYGLFAYEAMARGAAHVVGVEADPDRATIASRIAELHGGRYEIVAGRIEDLDLREGFDLVLLLNVLHHVSDPVTVMQRVAALCRGTVVVEFPMADHPGYISRVFSKGRPPRLRHQIAARAYSSALRVGTRRLPLMAVGNEGYHRTFYFNPSAFTNLFTIHHRLFDEITFTKSPDWPGRCLARCQVPR